MIARVRRPIAPEQRVAAMPPRRVEVTRTAGAESVLWQSGAVIVGHGGVTLDVPTKAAMVRESDWYVTLLRHDGVTVPSHGSGVIIEPITIPGIEARLANNKLHAAVPLSLMHAALPDNRLHATAEED